MTHTTYDFLFETHPPYISVGPPEPESDEWMPHFFYSRPDLDVCVRTLRGHKMRTYEGLMNEFAAALQFFSKFGENFNALHECLRDLDESIRADAYVLLIDRAEELLVDEEEADLERLFRALEWTGKWWSEPVVGNGRFDREPKPFQTLMRLSGDDVSAERLTRVASVSGKVPADRPDEKRAVALRVLGS